MTDEQIKKIAEEYEDSVDGYDYEDEQAQTTNTKMPYRDALAFLEWLNERYCLVEREEVFRLHNNAKMLEWNSNRDFNIIGKAAIKTLEELFGSETFNKKEE